MGHADRLLMEVRRKVGERGENTIGPIRAFSADDRNQTQLLRSYSLHTLIFETTTAVTDNLLVSLR